jgi:hypothetical protein
MEINFRRQLNPHLLLVLIFLLGLFFRLVNISQFNIYPDTYQSLLVAGNISDYQSVIGTLGPIGMLYPQYFSWTRPLYPLLINLFELFIPSIFTAAHAAATVSSLASIIVVYILVNRIFNSRAYGILPLLF